MSFTFCVVIKFALNLKFKKNFFQDIQELSLSEDVKESVRKFMCRPDVLLVTRLRCKNTGKFITVGNVHVNWGEFRLPNLQCVQVIINFLSNFYELQTSKYGLVLASF